MKEQFSRSRVVKDIISKNYYFYMRTIDQCDTDFRRKHFSEDRFRYAFLLEDMAGLVSSHQIAMFLLHHAEMFRENIHGNIGSEDLGLIKKFIADAYNEYKNIEYIPLEKLIEYDYE